MALNLTGGFFLGIVSLILNASTLGVVLYHFRKQKHRHVHYMIGTSAGLTFWVLFYTLGVLFVSQELVVLGIYSFLVTAVSAFPLIDALTRDSIEPIKMSMLCMLITLLIFFSLDPTSISFTTHPNGEQSVVYRTDYHVVNSLIVLLVAFSFLYYMTMIHRSAPRSLKPHTRLCLMTGIILGIIGPLIVILRIREVILGTGMLVVGIGLVPWTIAAVKQPRFAYILPFKVLRLTVIDTIGGISLFSHKWGSEELVDDALFSGMIQGIETILDESIRRGGIQEISLEGAVILMRRSETHPIATVLVTTRSSQALREALENFAVKFFFEYSQYFDNIYEISRFYGASEIIEEAFAFVPEYD